MLFRPNLVLAFAWHIWLTVESHVCLQ